MPCQDSVSPLAQERALNFFVKEPITWGNVARYAEEGSEKSLSNLGRSKAQLAHYLEAKKKLHAEFASLVDKIKIEDLGHDHVLNKEGKKIATKGASSVEIALVPNEFPYNFEPGVSHFLLWSLKPLSDSEVEKALSEHRKECEIIIFQNPPSLSSIPGLWHIHIVSRKRT